MFDPTAALVVLCGFLFLTFLLLSGKAKPERRRLWRWLALLSLSPVAGYLLLWTTAVVPVSWSLLEAAVLFAVVLIRNRSHWRQIWPPALLASLSAAPLSGVLLVLLAERIPLYTLLPPLGLISLVLCAAGHRANPPRHLLRAMGTGALGLLALTALLCPPLSLALFL